MKNKNLVFTAYFSFLVEKINNILNHFFKVHCRLGGFGHRKTDSVSSGLGSRIHQRRDAVIVTVRYVAVGDVGSNVAFQNVAIGNVANVSDVAIGDVAFRNVAIDQNVANASDVANGNSVYDSGNLADVGSIRNGTSSSSTQTRTQDIQQPAVSQHDGRKKSG
jgi:hypothetical protein